MNYRELLELAARAAGVEVAEAMLIGGAESAFDGGKLTGLRLESGGVWNALADDGDCARLEVACRLSIDVTEFGVLSERVDGIACFEAFSKHSGDRNKARRMASVRAAAVIGKAGAQ